MRKKKQNWRVRLLVGGRLFLYCNEGWGGKEERRRRR